MRKPPTQKDISSQDLFTLLLSLTPKKKIAFTLDDQPIEVKAINGTQLTQFYSSSSDQFREAKLLCQVCSGHPVFSDPEILLDYLLMPEINDLIDQVFTTLSIISPCYGYIEINEWNKVLMEGALHPQNSVITQLLGQCYEVYVTPHNEKMNYRIIERPDRYFGVPINQLLDCHLMVYRVARKIYEDGLKKIV